MGKQFAFQVTIYFVFWLKHNLILFNRIRRRFHHFLGVLIPIHHFCGSFVSVFWLSFVDGIHRRVDFVDTSDLDEFPAMKRVYIETGNAFVIVYAIDDKRSYEFAKSLCDEIYSIKGIVNIF